MKIEPRNEFWIAGLKTRTNNAAEMSGDNKIRELWKRLFAENIVAALDVVDSPIYAVYTDYASDQNGDYTFLLGYRVAGGASTLKGLDAVQVRTGKYAVLTAEAGPPPVVVPALWKRIWSMEEVQLGGKRAFQTDYEVHGEAPVEIHVGLR